MVNAGRSDRVIFPHTACRWVNYYLYHDNPGPTRGAPWDYVVPDSAFITMNITLDVSTGPHQPSQAAGNNTGAPGPAASAGRPTSTSLSVAAAAPQGGDDCPSAR